MDIFVVASMGGDVAIVDSAQCISHTITLDMIDYDRGLDMFERRGLRMDHQSSFS